MPLAKDNLRHHPRFPKKLQERVVVEVAEGLTAVPRIILLLFLCLLHLHHLLHHRGNDDRNDDWNGARQRQDFIIMRMNRSWRWIGWWLQRKGWWWRMIGWWRQMADSKPLTAITITTATPKIREFVLSVKWWRSKDLAAGTTWLTDSYSLEQSQE